MGLALDLVVPVPQLTYLAQAKREMISCMLRLKDFLKVSRELTIHSWRLLQDWLWLHLLSSTTHASLAVWCAVCAKSHFRLSPALRYFGGHPCTWTVDLKRPAHDNLYALRWYNNIVSYSWNPFHTVGITKNSLRTVTYSNWNATPPRSSYDLKWQKLQVVVYLSLHFSHHLVVLCIILNYCDT
jgi:hypothetical protein